ncbi:hypothetical protein D1632_12390 [Chryseobacterium nematophagum]|uniref:Uncharacterized protein n=1 Tax=Chryseobacterium nematophagum TaxID=2305228 RepID=A0A3M7L8S0_9FLAO|nr:hypothetical protein [Chryseobacterium nematophagum]RMZ58414.1 hypothetical protein D1632_12390 [Chryseobacterium nematophagum]
MASELEKRGYRKITVYLLDTILRASDPELIKLSPFPSDEKLSEEYEVPINSNSFIRTKNLLWVENMISGEDISTKLKFTKTILLKAMVQGDQDSSEYLQKLVSNNVDKILEYPEQLKIYPVNASHQNLLKEEQVILNIIKKK